MKHLFICAIGPVQDFIATARRSRDLWYGSWMLSELSKAAAHEFPPKALVFPSPTTPNALEPGSDFNVPNKIVAILDDNPEEVAKKIKGAIMIRLGELWKDASKEITGQVDEELAEKQIQDLPEFYWVTVPYDDTEENAYSDARNTAESLLVARKTTHDFKQIAGKNVPKSSLDGMRESVIDESEYPRPGADERERTKKASSLYWKYHARQGERLSAVDLLKRLGGKKESDKFRSTSHMAAIPFLKKIGDEEAGVLTTAIRELFKDPRYKELNIGESDDGALLFESRLVEGIPSGAEQKELRSKLDAILQDNVGDLRPSPYYALLAADGDNMGIVIDAQKDHVKHRILSATLSQFASDVPKIIKEGDGVLIYSGGDDVLAYLPLHTVLNCAAKLENVFKEKLKEFSTQSKGCTIHPTLSIGIVIAHHLEPLSDVLELARDAECKAKKTDPIHKNGLSITLRKRGGSDRTISGKWGLVYPRFTVLTGLFDQKAISAGTAYEFQQLQRDLSNTSIPSIGVAAEAQRIVKRKKESGGEKDIAPEVLELFELWINPGNGNAENGVSLDELALEMIIAGMFAGMESLQDEPIQFSKEVVQ